jgi:hypothetical protein
MFREDWSWVKSEVPYPPVFSHDTFLESFSWYKSHGDEVKVAEELLSVYDRVFRVESLRGLSVIRSAVKLSFSLKEIGATYAQFFEYASSLSWKSFGDVPPFQFLVTESFVGQFRGAFRKQFGKETSSVTTTYLGRILERVRSSVELSSPSVFEDYNWSVAEAIFEPLRQFADSNDVPPQLKVLVSRTVAEKNLPSFGLYFVTRDGLLTPSAVYWIAFAASKLRGPFCPESFGLWKDVVRDFACDAVRLDFLEVEP